jgi:ribonucleoside-diphosphate reductase alpha chain
MEASTRTPFREEISRHVWRTKYRYRIAGGGGDRSVEDTWRRVADALAAVETDDRQGWAERFRGILEGFRFLPAGRIQAGAGTPHQVTLFNCFVMGVLQDSIESIFEHVKEGAVTLQHGGGIGTDFSTLRPRGARARGSNTIASGPVSFMHVWDAMCAAMLSTGARRGAMMATLRCDHPDVGEFVVAKQSPGALRHFNLSVQVTDAFMQAVQEDADWPLVFPAEAVDGDGAVVQRLWTGCEAPVACRVLETVRARALWDRIMRSTYEYAEPGVLFVDQIQRFDNLAYRERLTATNPCGEVPLPPYGACDLGSINLARFVRDPFERTASLDLDALRATAEVATRLLDDVIDASRYPLEAQREQAHGARRIGLGLTGLADALILLGLPYGEPASLEVAGEAMRTICHAAYRTSIDLAREKGAFPFLDRRRHAESRFVRTLPADVQEGIARHGIRNSHLTAIAPAGTISLLANNVSSGLEPVFAARYERRVLNADGTTCAFDLSDHACRLWQQRQGSPDALPPAFLDAREIPPRAHLAMQAALQPHVDNSVSKTINVPGDYPFESFRGIYRLAWESGLKGCTTYRPNPVTGAVLRGADEGADAPHCCTPEREAD